ncbi:MAG: hypothetical protein HY905_19455 [Deltaproteobacteria bacterium]|nr:hypothetical protein [Deltaproteobacteria bacterium]
MRFAPILVTALLAAPRASARDDPATTADEPDHGPILVAVVASSDQLDDPSVRTDTLAILCDALPASGFACVPEDDVRAALGEAGTVRPGPDVLARLTETLEVPYAVAIVLYPSAEEGRIDADVFLQVRARTTGIFRGATDDPEDAADTAATTAEDLLRDAESRGFGGPDTIAGTDAAALGHLAPPADDGLIDLTINESLQGLAVAFLACSSFEIDDWRIIGPTLVMGAGAGLAAALLADYYLPIGQAEAATVAAGGWWGLLEGGLLAKTVGAHDFSAVAPWGLLGWGLGLGTGITLAATVDLKKGDVALVNSAAAWGTFAGAVAAGTILGRDVFTTSSDYDFAIPFAGLNAGILAGALTSIWVDVSRGRMALIDLSGLLGVLLGASLGTPLIFEDPTVDEKRWYSAIMLASAAVGLTVGGLLTADFDDDDGVAAAAMIEVTPQGDVSLHLPIPRPWMMPDPATSPTATRLGAWLGIAEGIW